MVQIDGRVFVGNKSIRRYCQGALGLISLALFFTSCAPSPQLDILKKKNNDTNEIPRTSSTRELQFAVDSNEFRAPVELLLVIDNSRSMEEEQQLLASGIESLVDSIYQRNQNQVNLRVVTTSADDWYGGEKFVSDTEVYYDYLDQDGNLVTTKDPSIFNSQSIPVTRRQRLEINPSLQSSNGTRIFEFSPSMSFDEFLNLKAEVTELISNIGTSGSDTERGLCSFGRILQENSLDKRFFESGDLAAAVIISDSNDQSSSSCVYEVTENFGPVDPSSQSLQSTDDPNHPGVEERRYTIKFQSTAKPLVQIKATRSYSGCLVDGQPQDDCTSNVTQNFWPSTMDSGIVPAYSESFQNCPSSLSNYFAQVKSWPIDEITSCQYRYITHWPALNFSDRDDFKSRDLCTDSFTYHSEVYANLEDYFRRTYHNNYYDISDPANYLVNSCTSVYRYRPSFGEIGSAISTPIASLLSSGEPDLKRAIKSKANEMFGEGSWFVSTVVDDGSDVSCSQDSESIGTDYLNFLNLLDPNFSSLLNICESSYAAALNPIQQFVETQTVNTYSVSLEDGESILSVSLVRSGQQTELDLSTQVEIHGARVRILDSVSLQSGDQLKIVIGSSA